MIDHTGLEISNPALSRAFSDPDGHNVEAVCHEPE